MSVTQKTKKKSNVDELYNGIINQDRVTIAKALSLIENNLPENQILADELLAKCLSLNINNTIRLGITGTPGVGKSTFIENFGLLLINNYNRKVAVVAVDPSSHITKGSILGDKTRMPKLSIEHKAFIRPTPTSGRIGGVSPRTRESIIIFEAAGFDTIFVETVGVGQSELEVITMTDLLIVLMISGGGDFLQGLKRGIMESVDLLIFTKAEGDNKIRANLAKKEYESALAYHSKNEFNWTPKVLTCSAINNIGLDEIWKSILDYTLQTKTNNFFYKKREMQNISWIRERLNEILKKEIIKKFESFEKLKNYKEMLKEVMSGKIKLYKLAEIILKKSF